QFAPLESSVTRWQPGGSLRQCDPLRLESSTMPHFRTCLVLAVLMAWANAALAVKLSFLTEEDPPFHYTENGKIAGSVTEIVQQISIRSGHPASIEMLPWDVAYGRAQGEKNTCLFATARLEHRERLFLWVGPLATNLWALYARGDFAVPIRTLK